MDAYFLLCERYAAIARKYYEGYQIAAETNCPEAMETPAICAIIFEALAVESYVNFFGVYTLGEKNFYENYESEIDRKHRRSTIEKIKCICKEKGFTSYPTDSKHFNSLIGLFKKRDRLVHSKPKPHQIDVRPFDYDHVEKSYSDYVAAFESEIGFVYENIDEEMKTYDELKKNLTACRSLESDPLELYYDNCVKGIGETIANSILAVFDK